MKRAVIALGLAYATSASVARSEPPLVVDAEEETEGKEPTRLDFAAALMKEGDYFRAVTVYKEAAFFEADERLRLDAKYQIGRAYRLSGRYELALRSYSAWLSAGGKETSQAGEGYVAMAASLLGMRAGAQAPYYLELAEARGEGALAEIYRGLMAMQGSDWDRAKIHLDRAMEDEPRGERAKLARSMLEASERAEHASTRSPALAGVFSAIVPGGGQAYTGHYVDAAQAFVFVGLLGATSFVAYRYEAPRDSGYPMTIASLSLTTLFHAANVVGAVKTADFFNRRQRELALEGLIPSALRLDY